MQTNSQIIAILFLLLIPVQLVAQDTYADTFSSVSYNNSNGTLPWTTSWIETGDTDLGPTADYISINSGRLQFYWNWGETVSRSMDLSGATSATISFDWETFSLEAGESLLLEISTDGITYDPTPLIELTGTNTGTITPIDISTYISATTTIRFRGRGTVAERWESDDFAYIDNLSISVTFDNDNDGDGIVDSIDLDDDNDGLTDEEEYCTTANASFLVSANVGQRSVIVNHTDTGYLRLDFSSMDNSFQLEINGNPVHPSILEFENGALGAGEEYFRFQSDNALISAPWVANSNGLPRLRLIIDESGQANLYGTRTSGSTILEPMQAESATPFNTINWIPGNNNTFEVINQAGPGPEGFTGTLFASAICDEDGDGISNELDLDADNDGIYDIVESGVLNLAGVSDANNDGIIDGAAASFGSNGLFSGIEDNDTAYAIPTYTPTDSDSDGIYDAFVLDADGDGCTDVIEAGFIDDNSDGLLGPLPVTIDGNGLVTSGTGGYTTPDDNDANTTFDFQEDVGVPTISVQPLSVTTCPGCTTSMTITSTANTLQWQRFDGISWVDLSDSALYSGTTTGTLQITNPAPALGNSQYRVIASNSNFVCGFTTSAVATLTFQVNTIITNRRITYRIRPN
ncbi:hypothetical protein [uncultured Croceitalea sp.]|uniref:immunoglobulin domain-containing protein n=1 Tax=uncultured Croceitalea sp. TaxID=1798908 RepID=UPI003305A68D